MKIRKGVNKYLIFFVGFCMFFLIAPNFIGIGLSNACVFINLVVIAYLAQSIVSLYEFYSGEEFSPGIQMYHISSLDEDASEENVIHRWVGAGIIVLIDLGVLYVLFVVGVC